MKKVIIFIAVFIIVISNITAAPILPQIEESGNGSKVSIYIPGFLFKAGSLFIDKKEDKEVRKFVSQIRGVQILVREGEYYKSRYDKKYQRIVRKMDKKGFDSLLSVRNEGTSADISIRENKKGKIRQVVVMVDEQDTFVLLRIKGNIDLNKLLELSQEFDF